MFAMTVFEGFLFRVNSSTDSRLQLPTRQDDAQVSIILQ
jgi:hypothetical protein